MSWTPTHHVHPDATAVWSQPDPTRTPDSNAAGGSPVQLLEQTTGWARVRFENGYEGWLDAATLEQIAVEPSRSGSWIPRLPMILIGAGAAIIGAVVAVVLAVGGGGSSPRPTGGVSATSVVHLNVPTGWSLSSDGLTTAQNFADLTAASPRGPRVRAVVGDPPGSSVDLMAAALNGPAATLTGGPNDTSISGQPAVGAAITANGVTHGYVALHPRGKPAVLFVLEAPAASFAADSNEMLAIPQVY